MQPNFYPHLYYITTSGVAVSVALVIPIYWFDYRNGAGPVQAPHGSDHQQRTPVLEGEELLKHTAK